MSLSRRRPPTSAEIEPRFVRMGEAATALEEALADLEEQQSLGNTLALGASTVRTPAGDVDGEPSLRPRDIAPVLHAGRRVEHAKRSMGARPSLLRRPRVELFGEGLSIAPAFSCALLHGRPTMDEARPVCFRLAAWFVPLSDAAS